MELAASSPGSGVKANTTTQLPLLKVLNLIKHRLLDSSLLLHLLDPSRLYIPPSIPQSETFAGSPYIHVASPAATEAAASADANSSAKLKRRLIDALAFICATERDAGGVSIAVALEQDVEKRGTEGGYTLRIAKSGGSTGTGTLGGEILSGLREIMQHLEAFADGSSKTPSVANLYHVTDAQVYIKIIQLNASRILFHLHEIREPILYLQSALEQHIDTIQSSTSVSSGSCTASNAVIKSLGHLPSSEAKRLLSWIQSFSTQLISALDDEVTVPISPVNAAYQVRRSPHYQHLETLCRVLGKPGIIVHTQKLGRYKAACRTLMHACQKWPGLFAGGMKIEVVDHMISTIEKHEDGVPLGMPVMREKVGEIWTKIAQRRLDLGDTSVITGAEEILYANISEEQFLKAWAKRMAAVTCPEARLISFYDQHPEKVPISGLSEDPPSTDNIESGTNKLHQAVRYIGLSKKPCYQCSLLVDRHPGRYLFGGLDGEKPGVPTKRIVEPSFGLCEANGVEYVEILGGMVKVLEGDVYAEVQRRIAGGIAGLGAGETRGRENKGKRVKRGLRKEKKEKEQSPVNDGKVQDDSCLNVEAKLAEVHALVDQKLSLPENAGEEGPAVKPPPSNEEQPDGDSMLQGNQDSNSIQVTASPDLEPTSSEEEGTQELPLTEVAVISSLSNNEGKREKEERDMISTTTDAADELKPSSASGGSETPTSEEDDKEVDDRSEGVALTDIMYHEQPNVPSTILDEPAIIPVGLTTDPMTSSTNIIGIPPPSTTSDNDDEAISPGEHIFRLLSPIPEAEYETSSADASDSDSDAEDIVLINIESILVRLEDEAGSKRRSRRRRRRKRSSSRAEQDGHELARATSPALKDLEGLDFTLTEVAESPTVDGFGLGIVNGGSNEDKEGLVTVRSEAVSDGERELVGLVSEPAAEVDEGQRKMTMDSIEVAAEHSAEVVEGTAAEDVPQPTVLSQKTVNPVGLAEDNLTGTKLEETEDSAAFKPGEAEVTEIERGEGRAELESTAEPQKSTESIKQLTVDQSAITGVSLDDESDAKEDGRAVTDSHQDTSIGAVGIADDGTAEESSPCITDSAIPDEQSKPTVETPKISHIPVGELGESEAKEATSPTCGENEQILHVIEASSVEASSAADLETALACAIETALPSTPSPETDSAKSGQRGQRDHSDDLSTSPVDIPLPTGSSTPGTSYSYSSTSSGPSATAHDVTLQENTHTPIATDIDSKGQGATPIESVKPITQTPTPPPRPLRPTPSFLALSSIRPNPRRASTVSVMVDRSSSGAHFDEMWSTQLAQLQIPTISSPSQAAILPSNSSTHSSINASNGSTTSKTDAPELMSDAAAASATDAVPITPTKQAPSGGGGWLGRRLMHAIFSSKPSAGPSKDQGAQNAPEDVVRPSTAPAGAKGPAAGTSFRAIVSLARLQQLQQERGK